MKQIAITAVLVVAILICTASCSRQQPDLVPRGNTPTGEVAEINISGTQSGGQSTVDWEELTKYTVKIALGVAEEQAQALGEESGVNADAFTQHAALEKRFYLTEQKQGGQQKAIDLYSVSLASADGEGGVGGGWRSYLLLEVTLPRGGGSGSYQVAKEELQEKGMSAITQELTENYGDTWDIFEVAQ